MFEQPIELFAVECAPLPLPLLQHVLQFIPVTTEQEYTHFRWNVGVHRANVFDRLDPMVQLDTRTLREKPQTDDLALTSSRVLQEFSSVLQKNFPRTTLANWNKRGFFEYMSRGRPNPTNIAALLIYQSLARSYRAGIPERDILPSSLSDRRWFAWGQTSPHAEIIPCCDVLPDQGERPQMLDGVDPGLILYWSAWPGAAWGTDAWLQVGSLGAISCGYLLAHSFEAVTREKVQRFLQVWRPQLLQEMPEFHDTSPHGRRLEQFHIPLHFLHLALWQLAALKLKGTSIPTSYEPFSLNHFR